MKRSQSILEYTILMIILVAAFITMQVYIKRGFQGRWKQSADDLGDQYDMNAFDSNVRYTLNTTTCSQATAEYGKLYNGDMGMMTYRQDIAVTIETKNGMAHIEGLH